MWPLVKIYRDWDGPDRVWRLFPLFWNDAVFWQSAPCHWKCELISDLTTPLNISFSSSDRYWICFHVFCVYACRTDPVCLRSVLCHRPGAYLQILLPETQSKSHQFLPGGSVCGSDWLADHWGCSGGLWFLPLIQVSSNRRKMSSLWFHSWINVKFGLTLLHRGFFPVAVGFIRRVPVLGSLLLLPGISSVSITHLMLTNHLTVILVQVKHPVFDTPNSQIPDKKLFHTDKQLFYYSAHFFKH